MTEPSALPVFPVHHPAARVRLDRRVRVLFLNDTARNGGPGRSLHTILKFLDPAAVHRAVVLPRSDEVLRLVKSDADEVHLVGDLVENPIEPWLRPMSRRDFEAPGALKTVRLAGNLVRAAGAVRRICSLARRGQADLIYCNGTTADFLGAAVSAITRVPALWHVRYTSVPSAVAGLHRRLAAADVVGRVVCVSGAAARLFAHCEGKVTIVHNGVDTTEFAAERVSGRLRAELKIGVEDIVFGSHGRVLRRKGYVEMLRSARLALDRLPEEERRRLWFVVLGDTPEDFPRDHLAECRSLAASLGLAERTHFLGFRSDVRPFVVDFDVAVVPSVYPDPLPRAVIESMALEVPVIAFDVGGVSEMIEPGLTGELVPFEAAGGGASASAIERLADAFVRYARDSTGRRRQGRAARDKVLRDFDARAHARRIQEEIVRAALSGAGLRR